MTDAIDILAIGEPMVEFNQAEGAGSLNYLQGFGGDTSNFAIAAARQGAKIGYVSALGDDLSLVRRDRDAELSWTDQRVRGALVRDAASGHVLAIMRTSGGRVVLPRRAVDVIVSDGVRSRAERLVVR